MPMLSSIYRTEFDLIPSTSPLAGATQKAKEEVLGTRLPSVRTQGSYLIYYLIRTL